MFCFASSLLLLFLFGIHTSLAGMAMGPGPGDFVRMASSPRAFEDFRDICQNATMTKTEVMSQLQSWAQSNGVASQLANATSRLQQRQQQMQSLANANLIGPALQLFNQIYALLTNNGITRVAECQGIRSAHNFSAGANNGSAGQQSQQSPQQQQQDVLRLVPMPPSSVPCPMYPMQCFRDIVPVSMPIIGRDEQEPGMVNNVVEFVKVPENLQPQPMVPAGGAVVDEGNA